MSDEELSAMNEIYTEKDMELSQMKNNSDELKEINRLVNLRLKLFNVPEIKYSNLSTYNRLVILLECMERTAKGIAV